MTTPQSPINSGFGRETTAAEVVRGHDLTGKVAIVTGGYSGLGLEATRVLSQAGATVIVPVRSPEKASTNLKGLDVETLPLELTDPASIDAFADAFLSSGSSLHYLINSAGIMMVPTLERDGRGNELQFSANHLGHFQLTHRLWPALVASGGARVVSVSSRGHRFDHVHFEDPNYENRTYDENGAYGQSKTANALFAVGLDRRGKPRNIRAFSVHPGAIPSDLSRHLSDDDLAASGVTRNADGSFTMEDPSLFKTVETGAGAIVWCALSTQLDGMGGVYCEDCDIARPAVPDDRTFGVANYACDPENAERLWTLSERLTGVSL
ncbi:SDR family NAD(P)-dependent oxidoreductase [Asticcacaulis sp. DXS10W]|uniref:SDR family NAD(P)-dependent oxidoreductase n=1 Tax=Asticcacaulis currens TaxID=2984210 RepID=A0ABT5IBB5_9CAUL|nr:SDR family NAD(P)-dependent oxidoreductase [Asticcacaulis currens]MDC7693466.1 SDR family NAD(P)-dependent oxidoreductase [Asticcacaulis currens]